MKLIGKGLFLFILIEMAFVVCLPSSRTSARLAQRFPTKLSMKYDKKRKNKFNICPKSQRDVNLDRQEIFFAMLGSMWSMGLIKDSIMDRPKST